MKTTKLKKALRIFQLGFVVLTAVIIILEFIEENNHGKIQS
ncbi:hypothetical protein [Chondrinema litorale]|nr:hypothetical protein [Chondrinema litorale]UZR95326.1 hypothetical protein OQ292_05765 [Chondrinema litorale]|tara:strand:- start:62 stop:184 length:123 start_codon:yes stop_codon:yes gene_type:complete